MSNRVLVALAVATALAAVGCRPQVPPPFTEAQRASVRLEVERAFDAFFAACERLDAGAALAANADSPAFRFVPLQAAVEGIRAILPSQFYDRAKAPAAIAIWRPGREHYNPDAGPRLSSDYEKGAAERVQALEKAVLEFLAQVQ